MYEVYVTTFCDPNATWTFAFAEEEVAREFCVHLRDNGRVVTDPEWVDISYLEPDTLEKALDDLNEMNT